MGAVIAGDSIHAANVAADIPMESIDNLFNQTTPVVMDGVYEYCDGFGALVSMHFMIYYRWQPFKAFRLAQEEIMPSRIKSPRPIRLPVDPGDIYTTEEMNPCEPVATRSAK